MAVAISAPDLYKKCKEAAIAPGFREDEIPALSTFKFQFWPKDPFTHSAMNYMGKVKVKYMVQQHNICKSHDDEYCCSAIYKYLHEQIVTHKDCAAFVSTDDKNKIKIGEPKCPITAATRGKRVLVATNQLLQAADHDFSTISVTPTVVLLHHIPADVEDSWYHGIPNTYLKLHATEPSTAVRNAKEIADVIIDHYGGKKELVPPILGIYTDGGPEHRLNFLSVQIAYIALQRFLDLDMLVAARTAPGHSFKNPQEKFNCILNLALYGIGCMQKEIHEVPEFEKKLGNCSGVNDV